MDDTIDTFLPLAEGALVVGVGGTSDAAELEVVRVGERAGTLDRLLLSLL